MKYNVLHKTCFNYQLPVISAHHVLQLKPRTLIGRQSLFSHNVTVSLGADLKESEDYFGNTLYELQLAQRHDTLEIQSRSELDVQPRDEILLELSPPWESVAQTLNQPQTDEQWEASQFCFPSSHIDPQAATDLANTIRQPNLSVLRLARNLTQTIYENFAYQGGVTDINTPVSQVIDKRTGVCQDFAHVAIAVFRHLGLSARYVSGYILSQLDNRPALVGAEASHAWISVYCPEFGWVDFDPTNDQITSDQHIVLAWGRDYADVAPTRGSILGGGQQSLEVDVKVRLAHTIKGV